MRPLPLLVVAVVVAVFAVGAWLNLRTPPAPEQETAGGFIVNADIGGTFTLTDQDGETVTQADFLGRYVLIYFGYTYCPDVCPTELGAMAAAIDMLGEAGEQVVPVLITIDPERDTPAVLAEYVPLFHERLVGLTGTPEQIRDVAEKYRVFYRRFEDPGFDAYLMDHSSYVYLLDPAGKVAAMFRYGTDPAEIAKTIRTVMGR